MGLSGILWTIIALVTVLTRTVTTDRQLTLSRPSTATIHCNTHHQAIAIVWKRTTIFVSTMISRNTTFTTAAMCWATIQDRCRRFISYIHVNFYSLFMLRKLSNIIYRLNHSCSCPPRSAPFSYLCVCSSSSFRPHSCA